MQGQQWSPGGAHWKDISQYACECAKRTKYYPPKADESKEEKTFGAPSASHRHAEVSNLKYPWMIKVFWQKNLRLFSKILQSLPRPTPPSYSVDLGAFNKEYSTKGTVLWKSMRQLQQLYPHRPLPTLRRSVGSLKFAKKSFAIQVCVSGHSVFEGSLQKRGGRLK